MMFFMAFMLGAFTLVNRRNIAQVEALSETQKIYSSSRTANEIYDSIFQTTGTAVVPITTFDQLKNAKTAQDDSSKTFKYLINGKVYTYKKDTNYVLQNDIILDMENTIHGKSNLDTVLLDYALYNSNYKINLNGHSIYYQLNDGSIWKLVCYQNAGKSAYFTSSNWGKNYASTAFSIIDDGIYPYERAWNSSNADQRYEFMLMFSTATGNVFDVSATSQGTYTYSRWRQKYNPKDDPTDTNGTQKSVDGYAAISIRYTDNLWGGLTKSTAGASYLDGTTGHGNWYYAVASISNWNGGIPSNSSAAKEEILFVRYK